MKNNKGSSDAGLLLTALIVITLLIGGGYGYVSNITKLTRCDFETPLKCEILRIIGIPVVPVGVVLGYVDIED